MHVFVLKMSEMREDLLEPIQDKLNVTRGILCTPQHLEDFLAVLALILAGLLLFSKTGTLTGMKWMARTGLNKLIRFA